MTRNCHSGIDYGKRSFRSTDTHHTRGDLKTLTLEWPGLNPPPPAQTTIFTQYNARGQPLRFQSPDGSVTTLAYNARGQLTQHTVLPAAGNLQTTQYQYDAAGQLKKATLPDLSFVNFSYDAAHRLTAIADSAGNRVGYVLDAAGNTTKRTDTGSVLQLDGRVKNTIDPQGASMVAQSAATPKALSTASVDAGNVALLATAPLAGAPSSVLISDAVAKNHNKMKSPTCRAACIAAGTGLRGLGGSMAGGLLGASGGTLIGPGFGTVAVAGVGVTYGRWAGAALGGLAGNALAEAICPEEDECEKRLRIDEDRCVAIAGARYGPRGIAICQHSAMQRYAECLRDGQNGVRTPLAGVETGL